MKKFFSMAWMAVLLGVLIGCTEREVSVVFDDEKGRFVSFVVDGKENFWVNPEPSADPRTGWVDYGGDKVWILPQASWKKYLGRVWPPGKDLEGLPWKAGEKGLHTARIEPAGVEIARYWIAMGDRGKYTGMTRFSDYWVALGTGEMGFSVSTQMKRVSETKDAPVHVWGVGQVPAGEFGLIGVGDGGLKEAMWFGNGKQGCSAVKRADGKIAVLVVRPGGVGGKVGTMGRWVAAVYEDRILMRRLSGPSENVGEYAERSSVQLFQTRDYWELETLSPVRNLKVGDEMIFWEEWAVWKRPPGLDEAGLALWVAEKVR